MEVCRCLRLNLDQILLRLKDLRIVHSYSLKIDFETIDDDFQNYLFEINQLLKKCLKKIPSRPRPAEIRNVISELVKKKNTEQSSQFSSGEIKSERNESKMCGKILTDARNLHDKMGRNSKTRLTTRLSGKSFLCEICGDKFLNTSSLKLHHLKAHDVGKRFKCHMCFRSYSSAANLGSHLKCHLENGREGSPRLEKEDKPTSVLVCPECKKSFCGEQSLNEHMSLKHSNKNSEFDCTVCGRSFGEKGKLNRHLLGHQRGRFECHTCSRIFHRKDNLRRHTVVSHQRLKTFHCRICVKSFSLKFNRDSHEKNVHNTEKIRCESCGQTCKNEATFKVHMKIHDKNFLSCTLCSKTFIRKVYYRNHLKKNHKGLSPFQKLFDSFEADLVNTGSDH